MNTLAIPIQRTDHIRGEARASVTLVEYGDFQCPSCKQAAPVVNLLLSRFPRDLRVVFRHFPLEEVHPHALDAALASEAAGGQRKFWPMHDLLFDNQERLKAMHLRRYAEQLKLDLARFDAETADTVHLQRVREDIRGAAASGVRATPTFFLNGVVVDTSFGLDALRKRVEAEVLARAR